MRILIADDDFISRTMLTSLLTKLGHDIAVGVDGEDAWRQLREPDAPRLAILDWIMPGIDGIDVCRRLRALENFEQPYIIMLTSKDDKEDVIAGLAAGADDYLAKPYDPGELGARVDVGRRMIEMRDRLRATETAHRNEQHLAGIGTLADGMAHEINNPLTGIMNYAQLIIDHLPDGQGRVDPVQLRKYAGEIIGEGERIAAIVRGLLLFSGQSGSGRVRVTPASLVETLITLYAGTARQAEIELHAEIADGLPAIDCIPSRILQVLYNLLRNADEAVRQLPEGRRRIVVRAGLAEDGRRVRLTVEDSGNGIPAELRERIFEPFFSTRQRNEGRGLGLSISYGIVRQHGGSLSFAPLPEHGTAFHVDLPPASAA